MVSPWRGGPRTQFRRVVRADTPARLSPVELAVTTSFGLTAVLDLRSEHELLAHPHPLAATAGYQSLPLIDPVAEARVDVHRLAGLGAVYSSSLQRNAKNIAAVFRALASTSTGPVVVSCRAGRDRTGMVVALLLDLAGVPRDLVVEDHVAAPVTTDHRVPDGADILRMLDHVTTR